MRVVAAGRSDVGLLREHNEDSFALLPAHELFIVADGMGGHRAGEVASQLATSTVTAFFDSTMREDATWPFHYDPALSVEENRLVTSIKVANRSIYEEGARAADHRGMGTTFVGLLVARQTNRVFVGHVGDSRCYRVRDGEITLLTQDHSLINEYIRTMPDLPAAQRDELPRNVITRALGMNDVVLVDLLADAAREDDIYVLCSDGLSGMISDDEILDVVTRHEDPEVACRALIAMANDHGGEDNITAVVIRLVDAEKDFVPRRAAGSMEETRQVALPDFNDLTTEQARNDLLVDIRDDFDVCATDPAIRVAELKSSRSKK
ncbi:MAG: serine/threonine-protein phosphatase [Myxococcaceae bacterium]|nr:MAG: serine/threonine-protein phosphatase [Myxococcaceae bacterium]